MNLFSFLFTLSCSENGIFSLPDKISDEDKESRSPHISVAPSALDFGVHTAEQAPVQRVFSIENIGSDTLNINSLVINGLQAMSFSFLQPPQTISLEPDEFWQGTLLFTASETAHQAELVINSNDTNQPIILLPLLGLGSQPKLIVHPNPLDMGDVGVGCQEAGQIFLTNQGTEDLNIESLSIPSLPEFSRETELPEPFILAPSQSQSLDFTFSPSNIVSVAAQFEISSNDPNNHTETVSLMGRGVADFHEESWVITEAPASDILFSIDLSSSMSDEQVALGQQFQTFITQLSSYTVDWQVMVVNADHGCNHSGILTQNTPNYESIFLTAVQTGAYDISFTEALLTAVANGVEKTDVSECNEGFLRPNAMLHIIMLSDECEQSPNPGICGTQWQDYVDRIIAQKGDPSLVRISAVAGDYPNGCTTTGQPNSQTAQFGSGYYEAAGATGGLFISICSDWTDPSYLQQLASTSVQNFHFELSDIPITNSITVSIDGSPLSSGWTYEQGSNLIILDQQPPELSTISVQYYSLPECSD